MTYVLDAGAVIAYLNGEPGADATEDILTEPGSLCYRTVHNLCEIYYIYYRRGGESTAEETVKDVARAGIHRRDDIDERFWKLAGSLKARHPLALPDGFCLALAMRIGATLVTTDHAEFDPLMSAGYCPIQFIR